MIRNARCLPMVAKRKRQSLLHEDHAMLHTVGTVAITRAWHYPGRTKFSFAQFIYLLMPCLAVYLMNRLILNMNLRMRRVASNNGLCNGFIWGCINRHSEDHDK